MTRKRTTQSLAQLLTQPCSVCNGRGVTQTPYVISHTIIREIQREYSRYTLNKLMVHAAPPVISLLENEEAETVTELVKAIGVPIHMRAEPLYDLERFDVVMV